MAFTAAVEAAKTWQASNPQNHILVECKQTTSESSQASMRLDSPLRLGESEVGVVCLVSCVETAIWNCQFQVRCTVNLKICC